MRVGNTDVLVPYPEFGGDSTHYDPDFRAKVAKALAEGADPATVPERIMSNRALRTHAKFLALLADGERDPMSVYKEYPDHAAVLNWASCSGGSQTRYYLDALLLSGQTIEVIAADMDISEEQVRLYEQLCMHCRDPKDYALKRAPRTLMALAAGPILDMPRNAPAQINWRLAAVTMGYSAIICWWNWERFAHGEVDKQIYRARDNVQLCIMQMAQRLRSGVLTPEDINAHLSASLDVQRLELEQQNAGKSGLGGLEFMQAVMQLLVLKVADNPEMVAMRIAQAREADSKKLLAEHAISEHVIADKGPAGTDVFDATTGAVIKSKFKGVMPDNGESP